MCIRDRSNTAPARSPEASGSPTARRGAGLNQDRPSPRKPGRHKGSSSRQSRAAWILSLPFMLLFVVFTAGPIISSLYMSLSDIKSRDLRSPFAVGFVGLENYAHILGDSSFRQSAYNTAYFVIIGVPLPLGIALASWRNFGTAMIIFLAGLQSVPVMLQEAAAIDGASSWQRFRHITLPLLRPTMLFVMVTTTIGYVQFFEEPFVMTNGGPLDSTKSMSMFTYEQFGFGNYGFASAAGYVLFVIIVALSAMQFRFFRSNT